MSLTGITFIDVLFFVNLLLLPLPVAFIFIQKKYDHEALNFLMILCLLNFIGNIFLFLLQHNAGIQHSIENIFAFLQVMIMLQIARSAATKKLKDPINIFSLIFLTATITFYLVRGTDQERTAMGFLQNVIVLVVFSIIVFELMSEGSLSIFSYPVFWIGTGTLFYFFIAMVVNAVGGREPDLADRVLMLEIATLVRYSFYVLAVWFYKKDPGSDESEDS